MDNKELIFKYQNLVKKIATKCFAKQQRKDGLLSYDDMVGMGFVGLLEASKRFNSDQYDKFATYAFHRIRGSILDGTDRFLRLKKNKKYEVTMINMDRELIEERLINENTIVNDLYKKELLSYIDVAIDRFLTEKQREVINLKYKKHMTNKEISQMLDITDARVHYLCKTAIKIIKRRINLDLDNNINSRKKVTA